MKLELQEERLQKTYAQCMENLADRAYQVPESKQKEFIAEINGLQKWGFFCFSVDLEKYAHLADGIVGDIRGVHHHLGFKEDEFSMSQYHRALHPDFSYSHYRYAIALVTLLTEKNHNIKLCYNQPLFTFIQSIKHKENKNRIVLVKRQLFPFQYNSKFQLTKYLNVFQVICEGNRDYSFHFLNASSNEDQEILREKIIARVRDGANEDFVSDVVFSPIRLKILRYYVEQRREGIESSNEDIAAKIFPRQENALISVKNDNKVILKSANAAFPFEHFKTMKDVAQYLDKHNLL